MSTSHLKSRSKEVVGETFTDAGSTRNVWLRAVCGACIVATILLLRMIIVRAHSGTEAQPVQVAPPVFESKALEGATLKATFIATNISGGVVKILGAQTTCSCTVAESDFPITLDPGASAPLAFRVTVGTLDSGGSLFERQAKLFLDCAGKTPDLRIRITIVKGDPVPLDQNRTPAILGTK